MLEVLLLAAALLGAVAAAYTDWKRRIIPNAITLPLISAGLLGNLALGISSGDLSPFYASLTGVAAIFAAGYAFWAIGAMPAGDVKGLMFIAALVPSYPRALLRFFTPALSPSYPFIFAVFFDTILATFPWAVLYSLYLAERRGALSRLLAPLGELREVLESAFVATAVLLFLNFMRLHAALIFLAILLVFSIERRRRLPLAGLLVVAYGIAGFRGGGAGVLEPLGATFLTIFAGLFLFKFLWGSLTFLGREALQEEKRVTELEEGDVLAERICEKGGKVLRDARGMRERIGSILRGEEEGVKEAATTAACGVGREEVERLRGYVAQGKLEDRIRVKKTIPFAPALLFGLLIALTVGDVFYWLAG